MSIKKYNEFIIEEKSFFKKAAISLAAMLSLGLSRSQISTIKDNNWKMSVVDTLINYNKNPRGLDFLKSTLSKKVDKPNKLIDEYLTILPDNTVVVKPNFIRGLKLDINPVDREFHVVYTIKF